MWVQLLIFVILKMLKLPSLNHIHSYSLWQETLRYTGWCHGLLLNNKCPNIFKTAAMSTPRSSVQACGVTSLAHYRKLLYWCHKGFKCLVYRQLSENFMVDTVISFFHTTFLWATCCVICFIIIVKPFLTHWSWVFLTMVRIVCLNWKYGLQWVWPVNNWC
jgi:hypothetical protein